MYFAALADGRTDDAQSLQAALAALGAPVDERSVASRSSLGGKAANWFPSAVDEALMMRQYESLMVRRKITGSTGDVRGTDEYTADSSIGAAAVHAGLVKIGETADIVVHFGGRKESFSGSERNGITSRGYGQSPRSYRLLALSENPDAPYMGNRTALRGNESAYLTLNMLSGQAPLKPGTSILVPVHGKPNGPVYGDETYASESSLDAAAVHAGVLKPNQFGLVQLIIEPGQDSYTGTIKNGVASTAWEKSRLSFRLEAVPRAVRSVGGVGGESGFGDPYGTGTGGGIGGVAPGGGGGVPAPGGGGGAAPEGGFGVPGLSPSKN
jgi:hypothetical protein